MNPEKELGPLRSLFMQMAIVQENKGKVQPVMDYCELNDHVDAVYEFDVSVLDLRKAYLQEHVHHSLAVPDCVY